MSPGITYELSLHRSVEAASSKEEASLAWAYHQSLLGLLWPEVI